MQRKLQLLALLFFVQQTFAQTPESLLEKIKANYAPEKFYLHYDKASYIAGETIWFKAYIMEGFLPGTKSTAVQVELLNDSGRAVLQQTLPVISSVAAGQFELDKSFPQGTYTVRAYTRRQMNFGTDRFYNHAIEIYNPLTPAPVGSELNELSVYFLPEGGNLIGNVKNTVAFKCTDRSGKPAEAEGMITDAAGNEPVFFKSTHNGMGKFEFIPIPGNKYFAEVTLGGTVKKNISLPEVLAEGVTLNVSRRAGKWIFETDKSTVINENFLPEYILGVQENAVVFRTPLTGAGKIVRAAVPAESLPTGILQLTVFNKSHQPLAERLVFINSGDYIVKGNFTANKHNPAPRSKNEYSFVLADTLGGTFSVAVTDADKEIKSAADPENIATRFLLTGELKGAVYDAARYFEANDERNANNLDLVMLTNGWRRYSWKEIYAGRFPAMNFKDLNYITASGIAYEPKTGKPLPDSELSLFVKTRDSATAFYVLPTDKDGNFTVSELLFEDTANFSFQKAGVASGKVGLKMTSPAITDMFRVSKGVPLAPRYVFPGASQFAQIKEAFSLKKTDRGTGILLDEVRIKAVTKSVSDLYEKKYVTGVLGGGAAKTYDFLKEPPRVPSTNILEYLKSRISGVNITGGPSNYQVNYRSHMSLSGGMIPMAIYIDEVQVDPMFASTVTAGRVAMVKVYSTGFSQAGGVLAIYTKKGDDGFAASQYSALNTVKVPGFSPAKEFYAPDYSGNKETYIITDERSTLYWNPYLFTRRDDKKINFSFYNSDKAKRLKVILEGMTEDGKLLHFEKILE